MMKWVTVLSAFALCAAVSPALIETLCRYTVRDIGFVDLHGPAYTLEVAPQRPARVSDEELKLLNDAAEHSNLRVVSAAVDGPIQPGRRVFALKSDHRDGLLLIKAADTNEGPDVARSVLNSPVQAVMTEQALSTFAFMVVVDSSEAKVNQSMNGMIAAATEQLEMLAPQLPRPIEQPVQVLHITPKQRGAEKVLLWSMKLDDLPVKQGAIAVFYGRAKAIGPALRGESLTQRSLLSQLALIGQSCECETDRDWAAEPSLPHVWTPTQQKAALESLGFQPDSPMVKSEVVRILSLVGKQKRVGLEDGEQNPNSVDNPLLGYGEFQVQGSGAAAAPSLADQALATPDGANPLLRTSSAGEGDWDFEEDAAQTTIEVGASTGSKTATTTGPGASPATTPGPTTSPAALANRISMLMILAGGFLVLTIALFIFAGGRYK